MRGCCTGETCKSKTSPTRVAVWVSVLLHIGSFALWSSSSRHHAAVSDAPIAMGIESYAIEMHSAPVAPSRSVKVMARPDQSLRRAPPEIHGVAPTSAGAVTPQEPVAQPPASYGSDGIAGNDAIGPYMKEVSRLIQRVQRYPAEAEAEEYEGVVVVLIVLARDGTLMDTSIETPSRFESLNQASLRAVREVGKFPPVPATVGDTFRFRQSIRYLLPQNQG